MEPEKEQLKEEANKEGISSWKPRPIMERLALLDIEKCR